MHEFVRYHPDFDIDVLSAASWYDERSESLGADFITRTHRAVNALIDDPERRNLSDYGIRYWPVERFPYVVFYDIVGREILITGVMHTSQDAEKFRKRCE